ncbi:hypothetical protein PR002_g31848 [Phytophthora rubi]|uniref:Uncharacterized protein n=1 Tax=Phytophthora rubi TaxID=129364 RepID=A0A6A3GCX4_9STRA|nr:hypothetical protein PR002_g31848 [Phytophthora rubi]
MASCGSPAASSVEAGGGVRARAWQAAAPQQQAASRLVAASALEHGKLRLPSSKLLAVSGSVAEVGDGVRTADGQLPLPSRRFMTSGAGATNRAIYFVE